MKALGKELFLRSDASQEFMIFIYQLEETIKEIMMIKLYTIIIRNYM